MSGGKYVGRVRVLSRAGSRQRGPSRPAEVGSLWWATPNRPRTHPAWSYSTHDPWPAGVTFMTYTETQSLESPVPETAGTPLPHQTPHDPLDEYPRRSRSPGTSSPRGRKVFKGSRRLSRPRRRGYRPPGNRRPANLPCFLYPRPVRCYRGARPVHGSLGLTSSCDLRVRRKVHDGRSNGDLSPRILDGTRGQERRREGEGKERRGGGRGRGESRRWGVRGRGADEGKEGENTTASIWFIKSLNFTS